ncbi:hypothetical protein [Dethiosulfatarculus sandiegensis]|uniref:hypothetical protein n=1 Tax=Dethiosulfatarculus sandiegensis TaxID=1429043 RepID=UPI0012E1A57A|nr:hypothetical protein [Dethiosulfatarculus sandiegensis]
MVVGDAKYPPFEFLSLDGKSHSIFVDVWNFWSQKTGTQVEYRLMEWSNAL